MLCDFPLQLFIVILYSPFIGENQKIFSNVVLPIKVRHYTLMWLQKAHQILLDHWNASVSEHIESRLKAEYITLQATIQSFIWKSDFCIINMGSAFEYMFILVPVSDSVTGCFLKDSVIIRVPLGVHVILKVVLFTNLVKYFHKFAENIWSIWKS